MRPLNGLVVAPLPRGAGADTGRSVARHAHLEDVLEALLRDIRDETDQET